MAVPGYVYLTDKANAVRATGCALLVVLSAGCGASFENLDAAHKVYETYTVYAHDHFSHDWGDDWVPAIATDGSDNWVIAWESNDDLDGYFDGAHSHVLLSRSADNGISWSDPEPANYTTFFADSDHSNPSLSANASGAWNLVWTSTALYTAALGYGCYLGGNGDLLSSVSLDAGLNWSEPLPVNSHACEPVDDNAALPVIAVDDAGTAVTVWVSNYDITGTIGTDPDFLSANSFDGGNTWSYPSIVNSYAALDNSVFVIYQDRFLDFATNGLGTWVAVWSTNFGSLGGSTYSDIFTARSADAGATWTAAQIVNSNSNTIPGVYSYNLSPQVRADRNGTWVAVWAAVADNLVDDDGNSGAGYEIAVSASHDDGATWSDIRAVDSSPWLFDLYPDICGDGSGTWIAIWRTAQDYKIVYDPYRSFYYDESIYISRSDDNGDTWSDAQRLFLEPGWREIFAQKPCIETDGHGNWVAVWSSNYDPDGTLGSDSDLFVSRSSDNGVTWTPARPLGRN